MRALLSYLLLLMPFMLFAQSDNVLKVDFIYHIKAKDYSMRQTYLFTNNSSSGIDNKIMSEPLVFGTDDNGNMTAVTNYGSESEEGDSYYTDYRTNTWIAKQFISDEYFIIQDNIPRFEWDFTGDKKTVAGYTCHAATMHFRGRDYIAYFAPDIPMSAGPYKFGGLPGLILEISTDDGEFAWYCKSIAKIKTEEKNQLTPPSGKRPISQIEYHQEIIDFYERFIDKLRNSETVTVDKAENITLNDFLELPEKKQ